MTADRKELYWSHYARSYDEDAEYVIGPALRRAIVQRLSEEHGLGNVVEFGCGTGYFTKAIANNAAHIFATDLSEEMLEAARRQLKEFGNITFRKDDCENSSFSSESFDTVFMANVIHTIEWPRKALQESRRILRQGGLLLLTSYTDYGTDWLERMGLGFRYFQKFGLPPFYYKNYSSDELAGLVEDAGFSLEAVRLIEEKANSLYLKGRKK